MTELHCFNQDNLTFFSVASVVFTGSLLVALKKYGFLVISKCGSKMGMQIW